jgi:hypothetical protein
MARRGLRCSLRRGAYTYNQPTAIKTGMY